MLFGEALQQVRKDKKMSQKELSAGILGRSHLSQIENNVYFPSYDKMFQFLDRLNITFEEFLFVKTEYQNDFKQQLKMDISEAANLNDFVKLEELAELSNQAYGRTNNITYRHYELISRALITYQEKMEITDEMIQFVLPIKDYLLSKDSWYLYELKLFNNIIFALSVEDAVMFAHRAMKRLHIFRSFTQHQHTEQHIYFNLSNLCLEHHDFKNAQFFSQKAIDLAQKYTLVHEKICAEINYGIANIKLGELDYERIQRNLLVLQYLNFDALYTHFLKHLEKLGIKLNGTQNMPRSTI